MGFLESYHELKAFHYRSKWGEYLSYSKRGLAHYPGVHGGLELFLKHADLKAQHFIDATDTIILGLAAQAQKVSLVSASEALLRGARAATQTTSAHPITCHPSSLWHFQDQADLLCLIPSADKGTLRVETELKASYDKLIKGGRAYWLMHKDLGAKRYESFAATIFDEVKILGKDKGWRLGVGYKHQDKALAIFRKVSFEAAGLKLSAEPGVFACGKLDAGTAFLLENLPLTSFAQKKLLDIGCGYGLLALKATQAGAEVSALDDDVLAVKSTLENAQDLGLKLEAFHSDVDSALPYSPQSFDIVLMNPPFHAGKQVILDIPKAFLAAAQQALKVGGELYLVANRALPYEVEFASWAKIQTLAENNVFKVIQAVKKSP
ncbi:MAG: methyltransferase [Deinococcales bacterium]